MGVCCGSSDQSRGGTAPGKIDEYGDDNSKYLFACGKYKKDDEIAELKQLMNLTEKKKKVHFSKSGLIQYIEKIVYEQGPEVDQLDKDKKFSQKIDEPNFKFWLENDADSRAITF